MNFFEHKLSYPQFLRYLLPSVLTMICLSFYTTIDGFFVSRYAGSDALAAINIVIPVTCVIFGSSVMLATGAGAILGEKLGQKKKHEADAIFTFITLVLLFLAAVFTLFGLLFLKPICLFLGSSPRLLPHVLPYARIVFLGSIPMSFKLFFEYMVRTDGHPHVGLAMSLTGLVCNVLLDALLVGHFQLGTFGAAWGTCLSMTISMLIGLGYFLKFSHLRFSRCHFEGELLLKSCANGCSELLTELSTGITTFLFNVIVLHFEGEDGVAAVTVIMYLYYFFIAFYMGIAVAAAPIISFNVGAGNPARIRETTRYSFQTIALTAVLILGISYGFGPALIHLFMEDGRVFQLTWSGLRLFAPVFAFIGWNVFLSGYFTALGDGFHSALISSLRSFVFVVSFILTLPKLLGLPGVWFTMPLSEAITIFISGYFYWCHGR